MLDMVSCGAEKFFRSRQYQALLAKEGRALFDRFEAHERYLVADLVDLSLSHVVG